MATDVIPAPPPGFELDQQDVPAPPPGFVLDSDVPKIGDAMPSIGGMMGQPTPEGVDGAPERMFPPDAFQGGNETAMALWGEQIAAQQGTSPVVRKMDGTLRYHPAGADVQEFWDKYNIVDPNTHVVLYDPAEGRMKVFKRSEETDEGRLMSFTRFLGMGMLSGPPTRLPGGATATAKAGKAADTLADFKAAGVDPNLAAVTGSRTAKHMQQVIHETPVAGGVVDKGVKRTLSQVEQAAENAAAGYGTGAGRFDAGRAAKSGAERFISSGAKLDDATAVRLPTRVAGFTEKADALYNNVAKFVPDDTVVTLDKATDALSGVKDRFPTSPELGKALVPAKFQKYADIIEEAGGKLTFGELRELRTFVGKQISNPSIIDDVSRADWKRLYGALSDDMRTIAAAQGPEALKAFERANKYYSAGLDRIESALTKILNPKTGEEAIYTDLINSASGKLKTASIERLRKIRSSMPKDEWATVASSVIRRMGKVADDGEFSVNTFATNYRNMSAQGKSLLFGNVATKQRVALDRLFRVADSLQDVDALANRSGTGRIGVGAALAVLGFSGFDGFLTAAGTVVSSAAAAKLMFSPKFVELLVNGPKVVRPGEQTAAYLARFRALASSDAELAPAIEEFIAAVRPSAAEDGEQ